MKTHRVVTMLRFIALTAVAGNLPQAAAESIVIRDTLVVEALRVPIELDRAPYSVNQLQLHEQAKTSSGLTYSSLLGSVPGLFVADRNNLSQGDRLSIRGVGSRASFGVRGIRVLLDGIPLTMPDGQSQISMADLSLLERVEVLRGPSSMLYGNAAGGVVRLLSARATVSGGSVGAVVGSHGLRQLRLRASHLSGPLAVQIGAIQTDSEGYRDHADARLRTFSLIGNHRTRPDLEISFVLHLHDAPWLLNPSSLSREAADGEPRSARFFVRQQGASKQVRHDQAGIGMNWQRHDREVVHLAVHGVRRSLLNPIPGDIIDLERSAGGVQLTWSRRSVLATGELDLLFGVDVESQSDERKEFDNEGLPDNEIGHYNDDYIFDRIIYGDILVDQQETIRGAGLFLRSIYSPSSAWCLTTGARVDRHSFDVEDDLLGDGDQSGNRSLSQLSPSVGLLYRPIGPLRLFANYSTAFQTPSTVEFGNRPDGAGGFNPDLDPEHIRSLELGARTLLPSQGWEIQGALFQLDFTDLLIPFQLADGDAVYYRNAGRARNRGVELYLTSNPSRELTLDLAGSLSDFAFTDYMLSTDAGEIDLGGNRVPGIPAVAAHAHVGYRSSRSGIFLHLLYRHRGEVFTDDFNGSRTDSRRHDVASSGYGRVDLVAGLRRPVHAWQMEGFVGIDNLLDESYDGSVTPNAFGGRYFEPAPGRTWRIGMFLSRQR